MHSVHNTRHNFAMNWHVIFGEAQWHPWFVQDRPNFESKFPASFFDHCVIMVGKIITKLAKHNREYILKALYNHWHTRARKIWVLSLNIFGVSTFVQMCIKWELLYQTQASRAGTSNYLSLPWTPGTVFTKGLKWRVLSLDLGHDLGQNSRRIY